MSPDIVVAGAGAGPWPAAPRRRSCQCGGQRVCRAVEITTFGIGTQPSELVMKPAMVWHGALVIALKNPGRYAAVSAFSPIVAPAPVVPALLA